MKSRRAYSDNASDKNNGFCDQSTQSAQSVKLGLVARSVFFAGFDFEKCTKKCVLCTSGYAICLESDNQMNWPPAKFGNNYTHTWYFRSDNGVP